MQLPNIWTERTLSAGGLRNVVLSSGESGRQREHCLPAGRVGARGPESRKALKGVSPSSLEPVDTSALEQVWREGLAGLASNATL